MSAKKQIPTRCKLYSFYEEIPEEFFDETDVNSSFNHSIFDISQSRHRIVRVSRSSDKKSFAVKWFRFRDLKTQQRYIIQEKWISPRENSFLWSTVCAIFSKLLIALASVYRFPYGSRNLGLDLQLLLNVPFQSNKYRKKQVCVENKVQETIGDVHCSTCRNEKRVYISTSKTTNFYDCKKCKACCHVFKIPFKDQKPTVMLFGGDGTHCFAKKTS